MCSVYTSRCVHVSFPAQPGVSAFITQATLRGYVHVCDEICAPFPIQMVIPLYYCYASEWE